MTERDLMRGVFECALGADDGPISTWTDVVERAEQERSRRRRRRYALAAPVLVVAVGGLAVGASLVVKPAPSSPAAVSATTSPATLDPSDIDCTTPGSQPKAVHIADDFGPIQAAYLCEKTFVGNESGRDRFVSVVSKLRDDDLPALTALLNRPDLPGSETPCDPVGMIAPDLWIVGNTVSNVRLPDGPCTSAIGLDEFNSLSWVEVARVDSSGG